MTADQSSSWLMFPWPDSVLGSKGHTLGATAMVISAENVIWAFFESHPLRS